MIMRCCHFDTNFVMCRQNKNKIKTGMKQNKERKKNRILNVCIYNYYYYDDYYGINTNMM